MRSERKCPLVEWGWGGGWCVCVCGGGGGGGGGDVCVCGGGGEGMCVCGGGGWVGGLLNSFAFVEILNLEFWQILYSYI